MVERRPYISVDEVMPEISLEQAAAYYGITLPELHRTGKETRLRCFLACGRSQETGERAIAIQENDPAKKWRCHAYSCGGKGGNLVSLCDLMKPGENMGGRPRGARFKEIAADLERMARGESAPPANPASVPTPSSSEEKDAEANLALADSPNERARELVSLHEAFIYPDQIERMTPAAASYFRRRPYLTTDVCREYPVGWLPQDAKSLLRGKIVYPYHSADGRLLTWFGRDPVFEQKLERWQGSDRRDPEPNKTQFVKGFHRGLELWGEHIVRRRPSAEPVKGQDALVLVEGPNDAIRMQTFDVPAVALCSNTITTDQVERIGRLCEDAHLKMVLVLLDNDADGENGVRQVLPLLAERLPIRLGWTTKTAGGRFRDRQPESLTLEEWSLLRETAR